MAAPPGNYSPGDPPGGPPDPDDHAPPAGRPRPARFGDGRGSAAKKRLADQLARRGLAPAPLVAAPLAADAADAVAASAVGYAFRTAVATPVSLLADGVHPAMSSTARLFALGMVAAAVTGTAGTALLHAGTQEKPAAKKPPARRPPAP